MRYYVVLLFLQIEGQFEIYWSKHCSVHGALYCTALYCTVMHCTALYCTALYCTALHCTVLHCTVLHYTVLHYTVLHCTVLHCTVLHYTVLHCTVLHYTVMHCNEQLLQCTEPNSLSTHFTSLHFNTLHLNVLQYTELHRPAGSFICGIYRFIGGGFNRAGAGGYSLKEQFFLTSHDRMYLAYIKVQLFMFLICVKKLENHQLISWSETLIISPHHYFKSFFKDAPFSLNVSCFKRRRT